MIKLFIQWRIIMDKKKILNKFGNRVREARLNKDWSQQD